MTNHTIPWAEVQQTLLFESVHLGFPIGLVVGLCLALAAMAAFLWLRKRGLRPGLSLSLCLLLYIAANAGIYRYAQAESDRARARERERLWQGREPPPPEEAALPERREDERRW
jgi:hypothetical protein